ncbi:MAG: hypothetical protein NW216_01075 [Hyphomicrobium sp.]|nr:hypothetical protein [Hyphomicrobium sp.]
MTGALVGAAIGAGIGIVQFLALRSVARDLKVKQPESSAGRILELVAWLDLVILPVAGYIVGAMLDSPMPGG